MKDNQINWKRNQEENKSYVGRKKLAKSTVSLRELREDITFRKKEQQFLDFKNMIGEMKDSIEDLENEDKEISPKVEENKKQERKGNDPF